MGKVKHLMRIFFFYLFLYGHFIFCMKNTDITKLSLELEQQLIDCKPTSQYLNFVFAHIFDPQDPRNQTNERCYFKFILNYAKKHWYCPETTLILLLVGQRLSLYNGLDINICEKIAFFITDSTCWNYFPLQRNFEKLKKTDTFSLTDNSVVQYFERNARSYPFDLQILIVRVNNDTTWNNRLEKLCHADRVIEAIDTIHQKYVPSDKITMTLECETNNISDYTLSIKALTKYYMHPLCIYPKPESCGLTIEYVHDPLYGLTY